MDKLEELREANKSQVKIYYTLDKCVVIPSLSLTDDQTTAHQRTGKDSRALSMKVFDPLRMLLLLHDSFNVPKISVDSLAAMLAETMPAASGKSVILMCGPPPMIDFAVRPNLDKVIFEPSCKLNMTRWDRSWGSPRVRCWRSRRIEGKASRCSVKVNFENCSMHSACVS